MQRFAHRRIVTGIVSIVATVALAAGCGVSAEAVRDALPARPAPEVATSTTVAGSTPTTEAESTTSTTEEAPTTTEAESTTTEAESTTTGPGDDDSDDDSGNLPQEAKSAFMAECTQGAPQDACACVWRALDEQVSASDLASAGSTGTLPADVQQTVIAAMARCMADPDAY